MVPDASTKLCCILGDPVEQSISPFLHNSAFASLELNYIYLTFRVKRNSLREVISGFRALSFVGANVTMPHKESVISLLDDLDPLVKRVGAVNTILNKDQVLTGFNTDVAGFAGPLKKRIHSLRGMRAVIIGAGGVSRAALVALVDGGCDDIVILNRTLKRGQELAGLIETRHSVKAIAKELSQENLDDIGEFDLIVNASPLNSNTDHASIKFNNLKAQSAIAYDLVYRPMETRFLTEMKESGAEVICGYEMLVEQAALSFEIWTDMNPSRNSMSRDALEVLRS